MYPFLFSGSSLCYRFAKLRDIVKKHKDEVEFVKTNLILTQGGQEGKDPQLNGTTHLKYPVPVKDVIEFIKLNRKYLRSQGGDSLEFNLEGDGDSDDGELKIKKKFKQVAMFDAEIVEFDDEFVDKKCQSELVFSIVVNR